MTRRLKVAYLVSHPIIYQAPLLRYITANSEIDLTVLFLSDFGVQGHRDPGFGHDVHWDVPLLDGYRSEFLPAVGRTDRLTAWAPWTRGLGERLTAGRFDALWLHGYAHQANIRAMMIARARGVRVLLRAESQMTSALRRPGMRRLKEAALRRLLSLADACLAIGTLNRRYYETYGVAPERIFPMPYAVDNAFFQGQTAQASLRREELRAELGLQPGRPCILYAAKFQSRKRPGDLLEAYRRLSPGGRREPVPYLLYVGDGEERVALEERVRGLGWESVRFLGFKNQTEIPRLYDLCDVFVLVSEREPWGLTVNEAMNAGKPVIVSDQVGSGCDLVREGENGYIVPTGDVEALAERLRRVTGDVALAKSMGAHGRRVIDGWSFREDVSGLESALAHTLALPVGRAGAGVA